MNFVKLIVIACSTFMISRWFSDDASSSIGFYALVTLPGTFAHELMHYLAALLTDGRPHGFSLIPSGNTLGSVQVYVNWYNAALIGLAPLLLAPLTLLIVAIAAKAKSLIKMLALSYVAACCWVACIPSAADLSIAASTPSSWPFGLFMLALTAWGTFRLSIALLPEGFTRARRP